MIEVGGVYRAQVCEVAVVVKVRRISTDGRWADVVGEMDGTWMRHGWRTRIAKLSPVEQTS